MFEPTFYEINSEFDGNLHRVAFDPKYDYVLRFIVDGWEAKQPDGARFREAARSVARVVGDAADLKTYGVKSVTFQHVPQGNVVGYYSLKWYSIPWGNGYTHNLSAEDGTWIIDLVFRPRYEHTTWPDTEVWNQLLQGSLAGSRGSPRVFTGGLLTLGPYAIDDAASALAYTKAKFFWQDVQPYWEVNSVEAEASATGYISKERTINKAPPGKAWNMQSVGQVGQDGFGIAMGSALCPSTLKPITIRRVSGGEDKDKELVIPPGPGPDIDPDTGLPKPPAGKLTWGNLPVTSKLAAAGVGAVGAAALMWTWGRLSR